MSVRAKQVNPAGTRVFMGLISDGMAVHEALLATAVDHNIQTATVELLGGLHQVTFTAYDFAQQKRLAPLSYQQPVEIVAGHGTITMLNGERHVHLHLAISFRDPSTSHGTVVVGGHVAEAHAFAVEFTVTAYDGAPVQRRYHQSTGLQLWDIE